MNRRTKLRANFQELVKNKVLLESATLQNTMPSACQIMAHIKILKIKIWNTYGNRLLHTVGKHFVGQI